MFRGNYDCGGVVLVVLDIPCDKGRIKTLLFSDVHYIKQILQITLRYSLCLVVFITTLKFSYQLNWTDYVRFNMTSHWLTIAFIVDNSWIFETSSFSYHFKLQRNRFFKRVDFIGCEKCVGTNPNILRWHWYNS